MTILRSLLNRTAGGLAASLVILASAASPAAAKLYGLVVGINDYKNLTPLKGAVNDANDVADALAGSGGEITKLLNADANRTRIESEWNRITGQAGPGDTFVFSYAGHGGQEPHTGPEPDEDGKDEAFLLAPFHPQRNNPNFRERIVDKEFVAWLKRASAKGIKIIVVADSCFAGGMTRNVSAALPTRYTPPYGEEPGMTFADTAKKAMASGGGAAPPTIPAIPNVSFFLAVSKDKLAPEVLIDGQARGALSFAFAKALRGGVTGTRGGISPFEIQRFATEQIVQYSEGQQTPDFQPLKLSEEPQLPSRSVADAAQQTTPQQADQSSTGTAVRGLADAVGKRRITVALDGPGTIGGLEGVTPVGDVSAADLVWNPSTREVKSNMGDVVAENINLNGLQAVVDKWRLLPSIKELIAGRNVTFKLSSGFRTYVLGEEFKLVSGAPANGRYIMVLDIGPDGGISILEPTTSIVRRPGDEKPWPAGRNYTLDIKVTPETGYGADHILLVSSSKPLSPVFSHQRLTASSLPALLEVALNGASFEMGLAGIYTRAR